MINRGRVQDVRTQVDKPGMALLTVVLVLAVDLVPDRPDFTESTNAVPRHTVQFENGFTLTRESRGSRMSLGEALVRVGVGRNTELRIGAEGSLLEGFARGRSDISIGAKVAILEQERSWISVSLLPAVSLPVGSAAFSSGGLDPGVKLAWSRGLNGSFALAGNVNLASVSRDGSRWVERAASWSLSRDVGAGWNSYWELFVVSPSEQRLASSWIANTGVSHSAGANARFDIRVGKRLSRSGPDWFAGAGIAIRSPAR